MWCDLVVAESKTMHAMTGDRSRARAVTAALASSRSDMVPPPARRRRLRPVRGPVLEGGTQLFRRDLPGKQHLPARPDRGEDEGAVRSGAARNLDATTIDFGDLARQLVFSETNTVCAKRIRKDDATAGFDVGAGDFLDSLRMREIPRVREVADAQAAFLQLSAPSAVR